MMQLQPSDKSKLPPLRIRNAFTSRGFVGELSNRLAGPTFTTQVEPHTNLNSLAEQISDELDADVCVSTDDNNLTSFNVVKRSRGKSTCKNAPVAVGLKLWYYLVLLLLVLVLLSTIYKIFA